MTEPSAVVSKDYWDIVMSQLRRRRSAVVAWIVLVLFGAMAVYAPLIANDRPLRFVGIDIGSYRSAQTLLVPIAQGLRDLIADTSRPASAEALGGERNAIMVRLDTMRTYLADEDAELLVEIEEQLDAAIADALGGDRTAATTRADALLDDVRRVRTELSPDAVTLQPLSSWPAFEVLSRAEVYFMLLWALILAWPLWSRAVNRFWLGNDRHRIRRARRPKAIAVFTLPVLAALVWQGAPGAFHTSSYKAGLTSGDIVADTVVFPPIPYGLAEINDSEMLRPPTWVAESEIDDSGYYLRGPRAPRADDAAGAQTVSIRVDVSYAEPDRNAPLRHPLGTDSLGRDILARIVWGARVSLSVGFVAALILLVIGTVLGSLAGYFGGWVDVVISRLIEVFQCFPVLFFAMIIVAFVGPSVFNIMIVIGLLRWTGVARLARGEFLRLRSQDFVVASQALGSTSARTIFRQVLPNALGPILVVFTFNVAAGILIESTLSYLGFGISLPIPSWGSLLIESSSAEHWWIQVFPGVFIFVTILLYNLLGEGLRDALDPRLKAR